MKQVGKILKQHGINPSFQRVRIYKMLMKESSHPTAEEVYETLHHEIPTLSRTTVYNTLKTLAEHGLISSVLIDGKEMRYDHRSDFHAHFKCSVCGAITDIEVDQYRVLEVIGKELPTSYQVDRHQICLYGVCKHCKGEIC